AQSQVLRGVVRGLSNKEIASELGNAEATVEVHVTRLLRKAGAGGRTALVTRFWGGPRTT
ncbi:MAG: response regulator transcription factor, partial [Myxococcota bacterium]